MSVKVTRFHAVWCAPCRALKPIIEKLEKEMPDVEFVEIDIDTGVGEEQKLISQYQIRAVPTLILSKDGKQKDSMVGLYDYDTIKERIESIK